MVVTLDAAFGGLLGVAPLRGYAQKLGKKRGGQRLRAGRL
jgi:hypothetical protein